MYKGVIMELSEKIKQDITKMFNQYLTEYKQVMAHDQAVIFARHKTNQNAMIMLKTYK